jgi:hypothetical protein
MTKTSSSPSDQADRIRQATGKAFPPPRMFASLEDLPVELEWDLEKVYHKWGSITAAYFLRGLTAAGLTEVKMYLDSKGWHSSAD